LENNNINKPAPKWGNYLYLIVPIILVLTMAYAVGEKTRPEKPKYYEIVSSFRTGQVVEYTLNLGSGALEYQLEGEKEKSKYREGMEWFVI
jgi:hypothetical protein